MRYDYRQSHAASYSEDYDFNLIPTNVSEVRIPNDKSSSHQNRTIQTQLPGKGKHALSWFFRMVLIIFLFILIAGLTTGIMFMGWVFSVLQDTPPLSADNIYQYMEQSSLVYDGTNNYLVTVETPIHRKIVAYQEIPEAVRNAFIAIEDERYWQHPGVDFKRLLGVIWINFRDGSRQGGSTLNQQLVKNLFLSPEQTYERKLKDIYYGIELQRQLTKEQILEAYLNHIYLGRGAYGIQAAAEVYFGKNAQDLTLTEAAYLASIPRNPTRYALTVEKPASALSSDELVIKDLDNERVLVPNQNAFFRQGLVLNAMLRNKLITDPGYREARQTPLESLLMGTHIFEYDYSWFFMDMVQKEAVEAIRSHYQITDPEALDLLMYGGFKIYTTLQPEQQRIIEAFYKDDRHFPGYNPEINQPQSAFVLYDHPTGEIAAIIGGRHIDEGRQLFNRAAEPRQPGSAMKVLAAYFPALENGFSPDVYINDAPIKYDLDDPDRIWPRNWYDGYRGRMTITEAVAQSSNVAGVAMLGKLTGEHEQNLAIMRDSLIRLGITTFVPKSSPVRLGTELLHDEVYSTVLGGMTYGVSPLEMAVAFGTFANGGVRAHPTVIRRIEDNSGDIIYQGVDHMRVTSPGIAYLMTDMLKAVVSEGTGRRAAITPNNQAIPVAGKTGTTTSQRDAWFVGYTPYYTATVWVGNDLNEDLVQGSAMAAQIWSDLMKEIHAEYEPRQFREATDIVQVVVNPHDSKLAGRSSSGITARYASGYQPVEISDWSWVNEAVPSDPDATDWFEPPVSTDNNWYNDPWR
ncbi:MAG: transglycosylase domain-containing protein [Bacillota bacterium]|nr:transglycosylase domain-containing protein [Bacillota bacterium]